MESKVPPESKESLPLSPELEKFIKKLTENLRSEDTKPENSEQEDTKQEKVRAVNDLSEIIKHHMTIPYDVREQKEAFLSNCKGLRDAWNRPLYSPLCFMVTMEVANKIIMATKEKSSLSFDDLYEKVASLRYGIEYGLKTPSESKDVNKFGEYRGCSCDLIDYLYNSESKEKFRYGDQIEHLAKLFYLNYLSIKVWSLPNGEYRNSIIKTTYNCENKYFPDIKCIHPMRISFSFEKNGGTNEGIKESIKIIPALDLIFEPRLELYVKHGGHNLYHISDYGIVLPYIEKLFEELKAMIGNIKTSQDREEAYYKVGKIFWLLSVICPFKRGSASINDIICRGILKSIFPDEPIYPFKQGSISPDLAAMFCPDEDLFARTFINFFDRSSFNQQFPRPSLENKTIAEILIEEIIEKHAPDGLKAHLMGLLIKNDKFVQGLRLDNEEKPENTSTCNIL